MFHRIFVEDWVQCIPILAFFIFAGVFVLVSLRALLLGAAERKRLASLPLDETAETPKPS